VPERLDFDGLAATRRDDPVADFGVHPGELDAWFARRKEAAGVYFDSIARAASVPGDDVGKHEIELVAHEVQIARVGQISASRFKEPQSGINSVVFRCFTSIREATRAYLAYTGDLDF